MQNNYANERLKNETVTFSQHLFSFLFSTLFLIVFLFEAVNTCFLIIISFAENKVLEKSKNAAKISVKTRV